MSTVPTGSSRLRLTAVALRLLRRHRRTTAFLVALILVLTLLDISLPVLVGSLIDGITHSLNSGPSGAMWPILMALAVLIIAVPTTSRLVRRVYSGRLFRIALQSRDELELATLAISSSPQTSQNRIVDEEAPCRPELAGKAAFDLLYETLGLTLVPYAALVFGALILLLASNMAVAVLIWVPLILYPLTTATRLQRVPLLSGRSSSLRAAIVIVSRTMLIGFAGYLVLNHRCTLGDYMMFIAVQDMMYGPVCELPKVLPKLRRQLSRVGWLFEGVNCSSYELPKLIPC